MTTDVLLADGRLGVSARGDRAWWLHRLVFMLVGVLPVRLRGRVRSFFFDRLFAQSPDPWGYSSSGFEERKRERLVAEVGPARVVLEFGCAQGLNLEALRRALPSATLVGVDVSARARELASRRFAGSDLVRVVSPADVRDAVGAARVDCVVLAEVLYYLGAPASMARALGPVREVMGSGARVVLLHGCVDAAALHARAVRALGLVEVCSTWVDDPDGALLVTVAALR